MTRNMKARSATEKLCASLSVPPTRLGTCVCVCRYMVLVIEFRRGAPRYEVKSAEHSVSVRFLV